MRANKPPSPVSAEIEELFQQLDQSRICTEEEIARSDRLVNASSRRSLLERSGIDQVLTDAAVRLVCDDALADEPPLKLIRGFITQTEYSVGKPILILMGSTGVGKTVAAAWALARRAGVYIEAEPLMRLVRSKWREDKLALDRLLRAGLLVVDELGTEEDVPATVAVYRELINKRQSRLRPTILLGNLEKPQLKVRFESRTWDRLDALAIVRGVEGHSLRQKESK